MQKLEKDQSFVIKEDQWSSDYFTVKTDGTVIAECDDRKEQQYSVYATWSWADFVAQHKESKEAIKIEVVAFLLKLLQA
jgi:hypothetical protein